MIKDESFNYDATSSEQLEEILLFWIFVAGKNSAQTARKLDTFLRPTYNYHILPPDPDAEPWVGATPFEYLRYLRIFGRLEAAIRDARFGKYGLLANAVRYILDNIAGKKDLRTITLAELEAIPGVGPKTARCFVMRSRKGQRLAGLDTHILKFLRLRGHTTLKSTPSGPTYERLEKAFLAEADRLGIESSTLDAVLWNYYAKRLPPDDASWVEQKLLIPAQAVA